MSGRLAVPYERNIPTMRIHVVFILAPDDRD